MPYYVYIIISKYNRRLISYVGYTSNLYKRLTDHNNSKGAKFTKGKKWEYLYIKEYKSKVTAMSEEYKLKKNYKLRNYLKSKYTSK